MYYCPSHKYLTSYRKTILPNFFVRKMWFEHFFLPSRTHRVIWLWKYRHFCRKLACDSTLLFWIGRKLFEMNPPEPTLIHIFWCIGSENLLKLKSFNQGFFDWIKIVDFLIVKLIAFRDLKMTPNNNQFYYKKIHNFDPIKKALVEWF